MGREPHALVCALPDRCPRHLSAVAVGGRYPVIVGDPGSVGVALADPDDRPATRPGQHQEVVRIGGVDAPLLMRRDEVQDHLRIAVVAFLPDGVDGPGVARRLVAAEALTDGPPPGSLRVGLWTERTGGERE